MGGPLLLFDSGVGGLSVLGPVRARMPGVAVVYAADNAAAPYGPKSEADIAARVTAVLTRLVDRYRPGLVVIACNTACTVALDAFRAAIDVPIVGTVPAIKPAAAVTASHVIGVLGTAATVRQPYVARLAAEFAAGCTVLRYGSSALVTQAERKLAGEPVDLGVVRTELDGLLGQRHGDRLDAVALACTHFPLLLPELLAVAPRALSFVDGGDGIARRVASLARPGVLTQGPGLAVFTRAGPDVDRLAPALAAYGLGRTEVLEVEPALV